MQSGFMQLCKIHKSVINKIRSDQKIDHFDLAMPKSISRSRAGKV